MPSLNDKKILLGISGGIAAYKSALLLRELQRSGASVRVAMTQAAEAFVTPLTFQALCGERVYTQLLNADQEAAMNHIELARWADLVLVAPASADFMARLAHGMANDLLSTLCLASSAPIMLAPAMNQQMWLNQATQQNVLQLQQRGIGIWGPDDGLQACGEHGPGRMLEPDSLQRRVEAFFSPGPLHGIRLLITAGPTREPIDPVRFIGNRSSGKMGFSLAGAFQQLGAEVCLISGPITLETPAGVERVDVETAVDMRQAVMDRIAECEIFIAVAAVADYRPVRVAGQKIKKSSDKLDLNLILNPDILAEVAGLDGRPFCVGFAAETEQLEIHAEAKRRAKGVDLIAANLVAAGRGGFETEENALLLLWEGGKVQFPLMNKSDLARQVAEQISQQYHEAVRNSEA